MLGLKFRVKFMIGLGLELWSVSGSGSELMLIKSISCYIILFYIVEISPSKHRKLMSLILISHNY